MLKKDGVTHTSITAENIECVSSGHDAKLTGFSAAGRTSELSKQEIPIICGFSAPEILLNAPVDESADIWGLACTLAGLCFGFPMFPAECNYEYMRMILQLLGPPSRSLLDQGVYCFETFLGGGSFGVVSKFKKLEDDSRVAVKLLTNKTSFTNEVRGLSCLRELDPNKSNIIRCIDHFPYKGSYLIFYELLDQDLCDFMAKRINKPLKMGEVRCIAKQLLVSLRELKHIHVTHLDIKPNNILLVNHSLWPFKLIGFGSAHETGTSTNITKVQTVGYRAPEVHMGLPFDESIDIWGLGCTLVFLYLAKHLHRFFVLRKNVLGHNYNPNRGTGKTVPSLHPFYEHLQSLDDLVTMTSDLESLAEQEDLKDFVNLVKRMIVLKPSDRIRPDEALKHPFILRGQYPNTSSHPSVCEKFICSTAIGVNARAADQIEERSLESAGASCG
uniref:Protein kinase domain-containing protein n=1 Tax=Nothobranchius furzeri TaxID=105023 RepID=A0A8C6MDL0_NOTFU